MRVIMTCAGTGGHIYPALAIAETIRKHEADSEIIFIGSGRSLEKEVIPASGYDLKIIDARGFDRKKLYKNIGTFKDLISGRVQAGKIIRRFKPDLVIGTGGYVCVPVIMASHAQGIKSYIHEQNAIPGLANLWLEKYCQNVFLGFAEAASYFKNREKCIVSGNPVREIIGKRKREEAREILGFSEKDMSVLIFGGSQGAGAINSFTIQIMPLLLEKKNIKLTFITGAYYFKAAMNDLEEKGLIDNPDLKLMAYTDQMDIHLKAADLVVSRAGALTVAEIILAGVPAILIPSPNVTGNHQYFNAKALSEKGGAHILEEAGMTGQSLYEEMMALINDKEKLGHMSKAIAEIGYRDGAEEIYKAIRGKGFINEKQA